MSTERDPRTDPRPGDVRKNPITGWTYEVLGVVHGSVKYRKTILEDIPLDGWREITATTRCIVRGKERGA